MRTCNYLDTLSRRVATMLCPAIELAAAESRRVTLLFSARKRGRARERESTALSRTSLSLSYSPVTWATRKHILHEGISELSPLLSTTDIAEDILGKTVDVLRAREASTAFIL